jgi:hypothetical protein
MKARVKATGEIIELCNMEFDEDGNDYYRDELELIGDYEPDYWEKLKHQYAGMSMQGILSNNDLLTALCDGNKEVPISKIVLNNADIIATALVNRLKEDKL